MLCENCGETDATIHINQIVNKEIKTLHLCLSCAKEQGLTGDSPSGIDLENVIEKLVPQALENIDEGDEEPFKETISHGQRVCPRCGTALSDIKQSGRLGCADCYRAFREDLLPLLSQLHRGCKHASDHENPLSEPEEKTPPLTYPEMSDEEKEAIVEDLRTKLEEAVSAEHYELAAQLRDQLRNLTETE